MSSVLTAQRTLIKDCVSATPVATKRFAAQTGAL